MDPIEKAIRNALEKGDVEDRTFREKVYRSAFAALERATKAQPDLTVEVAINRRKNLQARITSIESEFLPALPAQQEAQPLAAFPEPDQSPGPDVGRVDANSGSAASGPTVEIDSALDIDPRRAAASPSVDIDLDRSPDAPTPPVATVSPDRDAARARPRRRGFATLFVVATLIAGAGVAGWWAFQMGLFKMPSEIDTSVPNPPKVVEGEDFIPQEDAAGTAQSGLLPDRRNWIVVFTPSDPSSVNAPNGATAEVNNDDSGSFLRIRSGASGTAVVFDVGQGILEQIAGRKAVFDVVARGEDGKQTQISVSCDFGELGDCGRNRYAVGIDRAEYLFDIELPAKSPGAAGSIAINSDFVNEGNAVDIYEIRVAVTE